MTTAPHLGFGLGYRPKYHGALVRGHDVASGELGRGRVDWLEIVSENYLGVGGRPRRILEEARAIYPLVMHGVGLSIAGTDPLNDVYLTALKTLADRIEPRLVSDHLCWTSHRGSNSHDLLPIVYSAETLRHVASRVRQVQDRLGRRLYLENPSAYVAFAASDMSESEFLAQLSRMTGCGLLLDVNNLYVNSRNLGLESMSYLDCLDPATIGYFHLAGHTVRPDIRVDTHDEPVPEAVWDLYREAVRRFPDVPTLVEWDARLPEFPELLAELDRARAAHAEALSSQARSTPVLPSATPSATGAMVGSAGSWKSVQDDFFDMVTSGEGVAAPEAVRGAAALGHLLRDRPASPETGAGVYADAYYLRIIEVARECHPALVNVLGHRAFDDLIIAYLKRHPSREVSIKYSTDRLQKFIESHAFPVDFGVPQGVLRDLAALEQAVEFIGDAADSPSAIGVGALEEIAPEAWEDIGFDFIQALTVVHVGYHVGAVVDAVADGRTPERPVAKPGAYAVFRLAEDVEWRVLGTEEGRALELLASGVSFRETVDQLATANAEVDPELVERVVAGLVRWISWGLVHGIRPGQ